MAVRSGRALVLGRTPFGESSLVVHLFTESYGRVHLLAKGAYRPTSRFFAVLDLFDTLELEWSTPRSSELGILRTGRIGRRRRRITEDLEAYRAALTALELCDLAVRPADANPRLFASIEGLLETLDSAPPRVHPELALVVFELSFLQNLGLAPALRHCAACGDEARPVSPGRAAFSAGAGGRLCQEHAREARRAGRRVGTLPLDVLDAAADLQAGRSLPKLSSDLRLRLLDFVARFLDYHLETRPVGHRRLLATANRNAPSP